MAKWLVDGELRDTVAVSDRGLTYGDGLFETIAVRQGQCRFLNDHLRRLGAGCSRLRIPEPDRDTLESEIHSLAAGCERGALKLIITRDVREK